MSAALYPVQSCELFLPPQEEVAKVLEDGLKANFHGDVSVNIVDCPNLTCQPWGLAAPGLCGSPRLLDIGGVPYLVPLADRTKFYDLKEMARLAELPGAFLLGAGAGSSRVAGVNCEMMPNARVQGNGSSEVNNTYIAKVSKQDNSIVLEKFNSLETGPLANVLACEGRPGKVFEVKAKCRQGGENFVTCMRKALGAKYKDQPVSLGGVFHIVKGTAKLHVMPEFSQKPLECDDDMNNWLQFYEVQAPLICLSVFISHDPDFDLRVEHTHCYSDHGEGGHYHYDTTPTEVEYHGYFTLAEKLYRIDRPTVTHNIGRD